MADLPGPTSSQTSTGVPTNGARDTTGIIAKVRDTATAQLTSQKDRATDGLGSISRAVRQSTHQLRNEEHDVLAHYIEQAADQIDRLSQRMRDKNVGDLMRDVQQIARRRPALFIGGAFAVGLVGARFFKSSSSRTTYTAGQDGDQASAARSTASEGMGYGRGMTSMAGGAAGNRSVADSIGAGASAQSDFEADDTGIAVATTDVDTMSGMPARRPHASTSRSNRGGQSGGS